METESAPPSFEQESRVTRLDTSTFGAHLDRAFCVGNVPNGGFVAGIFLQVARAYLIGRNHPDTVAAQWQFLDVPEEGPAILVVDEAKMGRGMSVIHVTLYQGGLLAHGPWASQDSRRCVVAYMTNSTLAGEAGITLPTFFQLPESPPRADLQLLVEDRDPYWTRLRMSTMMYVPTLYNFEFYRPRRRPGPPDAPPSVQYDLWVRQACGERMGPAALPYVADSGPPLIVESFRPEGPQERVPPGGFAFDSVFWYPTVSMSIEIKKPLPPGGVEWLRLRVGAKVLRNGRYDAEVIVFDEQSDIVALSNHVSLAVDSGRSREKL